MWEEAENAFWPGWFNNHDQVKTELKETFTRQTTDTRVELSKLTGERDQLAANKERLTRELLQIEQDLKRVNDEAERKAEQLFQIESDYGKELSDEIANHKSGTEKMEIFFTEKLGRSADERGYDHASVRVSRRTVPVRYVDPEETEPEPETVLSSEPEAMDGVEEVMPQESTPRPHGEVLVEVLDADDNVIGSIERVEPWNQWVEAILRYPVQRPVVIRRGRRFNEDHLASIYERTEGKGVKWLSCMIQATGRVQTRRCLSCDKNQGVFGSCIMVGGKLLHKCGNCEWNRQGCHGASMDFEPEPPREPPKPNPDPREPSRREINGPGPEIPDPETEAERLEPSSPLREPSRRETRDVEMQDGDDRQQVLEPHAAGPESEVRESTAERARRLSEILSRPHDLRHEVVTHTVPTAQTARPAGSRVDKPMDRPLARPTVIEPEPRPVSGWAAIRSSNSQSVLQAPAAATPPAEVMATPRQVSSAYLGPSEKRKEYSGPLSAPSPSPFQAPMGFTAANVPRAFTPVNSRSRPQSRQSSGHLATPNIDSAEPSPQPAEADDDDEPLEEITSRNLVLRDNGEVYTYPECMRGVPLVKIDENHPYWDPEWKDLKTEVKAQHDRWEQKLETHRQNADNQKPLSSIKYQIGRQINRGQTILEFLEMGTISPYQLLAKGYMHAAKGAQKGGITSYDTLFRMCESIAELSKFKLDITPVEWMRHRLWEISVKKGKEFNCAKILHDFYHDPKLTALRVKHGFKNIGRPSGMKKGRSSANGKRKGSHDSETPDARVALSLGEPLPTSPRHAPSPAPKRPYRGSAVIYGPPTDSFVTHDYSDTDSVFGTTAYREEYRVAQIKHRRHASSTNSSQYWSWQPDRKAFEHQVVKSVDPVKWGFIDKPVDFHVNLEEIHEIVWNLQILRIQIRVDALCKSAVILEVDGKPRGDLMVSFKRERTMKRFMFFCRGKKVNLVKASP